MIFVILRQNLWAIHVIGVSNHWKTFPHLTPLTGINIFYWPNKTETVRLFYFFRWLHKPCISQSARSSEASCLGLLHSSTRGYCYWHVHRARSVIHRYTKPQGNQDPLQYCSQTTGISLNVFPCQLVWVYAWSIFCMGTAEDPPLRYFATMLVKDQVLGNIFGKTFSDSFRQNLSPHPHFQYILQSIFCLLVEVAYRPCSLKFVYPTIKLAFLGIIVKVKLLWIESEKREKIKMK